jgi:hypothetical protein
VLLPLYIVDLGNTSHVRVLYCVAAFRVAVALWMKNSLVSRKEDTCFFNLLLFLSVPLKIPLPFLSGFSNWFFLIL